MVQAPWSWKTQKSGSFKHLKIEKVKNHAGSTTVKLENSKPSSIKHCEVKKLKNHAVSSTVKLKNSKTILLQAPSS